MQITNGIRNWAKNLVRGTVLKTLRDVSQTRGWVRILYESFSGAFQTGDSATTDDPSAHPTVYACITQIAYDIGKLKLNLVEYDENGISTIVKKDPLNLLFRKPNKYQIRQKFIESWIVSLYNSGNAYILKVRDKNKKIKELHVLDPYRVTPLVSDDGMVFYKIKKDCLAGIPKDIDAIPGYEIIHDTLITLGHPLIGVSPLHAAILATNQGLAIQSHSTSFFKNKATPGGLLTAPGHIKKEIAEKIQERWVEAYSGENSGKVAVLGDGLKYESMAANAVDSELVNQLKWSDEKICSTFKVPPYKVHVGPPPTYEQSETLDRKYYSDCLQSRIESIESLLDDGLGVDLEHGSQFNLNDLLKMDFKLQVETQVTGVKGGVVAPNEARKRMNLSPVAGGDTPYMQQQNYSLEALSLRDSENPLSVNKAKTQKIENEEEEEQIKMFSWLNELSLKEDLVGSEAIQ